MGPATSVRSICSRQSFSPYTTPQISNSLDFIIVVIVGWVDLCFMLYSPLCKLKSQSSNTLYSFQVCCLGNQPVSTPCEVEPNDVHPVLSHSACGLPFPTDPAPRVPWTPKRVCTRQNHFLGLTQAPGHILKTKSAAVR